MRIVLAPDAFKGCLRASQVCEALERGVHAALPGAQVVKVPMADGGEGTVQALVDATGGELVVEVVEGPLGDPLEAVFGLLGDGQSAVIEMAAASGLTLVPEGQRNPLRTSTFGTGQLIRAALDRGRRKLIVGIGGSATNDGGGGMAQALGVRFLDSQGGEIARVTGGRLADVAHIDVAGLDPRLREAQVRVACDVDNPLYGRSGAAHVYGPQKGATPEMVKTLDAGLRHLAHRLKVDLGVDVTGLPGAGAAGGLGAGLVAFCSATLERGVDIVMEAVGLAEKMQGADLVITGEGKIDRQTAFGKTVSGVTRLAKELGVPVVAVGGAVELAARALHQQGLAALLAIANQPMTLEESMEPQRAMELLEFAAEQIVRMFLLGRGS